MTAKDVVVSVALLTCLLAGLNAEAVGPAGGRAAAKGLTVMLTDAPSHEGVIFVSVFDKKDGFPSDETKALVTATVSPKKSVYHFEQLPPGDYAVVAHHDMNKNGEVDKNLIGIPKEPIGISNYRKLGITSIPRFRKALVSVGSSSTVHVKLCGFGG